MSSSTQPTDLGSSFTSHVMPYGVFVIVGSSASYWPAAMAGWADPLRVVAAACALGIFWAQGAYPELAERKTTCKGATFWALLAGLAAGLAWVPLTEISPWSLGSRGGFDVADASVVAWIARICGTLLIVPVAEELLVRSLVPRFVDAGSRPWTEHPVGVLSPLAFLISLAFFVGTHPEVLAALVVGVVWTLLLKATRRLRDVVLAHMVANAVLAAWVVWSGETHWW